MKQSQFIQALTLALAIGSLGTASAQGTAPKPKPVAKAVMSKDELRACMKLNADTKAKAQLLEAPVATLAADRQKIDDAKAEIAVIRQEVDKHKDAFQTANDAVKSSTSRIDAWSAELKELEASPMKSAERRKKELLLERNELASKEKALIVQRDSEYKLYEAAVARFNERGKGLDAQVLDWNQRNKSLASELDRVTDMREEYAADCANRRFREDDETAIKSGK
jgi:chromosome segregation ATPase